MTCNERINEKFYNKIKARDCASPSKVSRRYWDGPDEFFGLDLS